MCPIREAERIFSEELEKKLWKHAGKWVAIVDDEIVAEGETLSEVAGKARAAGHEEPFVYCVPAEGQSFFF